MFESDTWCFSRFAEARDWLAARAITPLALMWGEEWYTRPEVKTWPYFAGFSGMAFADRLRARVDQILVLLRSVMPGVPIVQVENWWNNDPSLGGVGFYRPVFTQTDVLGLDAYLTTGGVPEWGTPALTSVADQAMLNKFYTEVGRFYEHAATYGKPLMAVGQAFRIPESPLWSVAPTPDQLEWFYVLAQRTPVVVGLAWFAVEAWANGLLRPDLAAQAQRVQELYAYNAQLI